MYAARGARTPAGSFLGLERPLKPAPPGRHAQLILAASASTDGSAGGPFRFRLGERLDI
jgi:hypothetical protein